MLSPVLLMIFGFILLGAGAEIMVTASSKLALRLGVTPLIVGLTVVAFGTSSPELAVSIKAAASDSSALALGNVIGSNIANIGLILGLTAIIYPIKIEKQLVRKQIPLLIFASILMGFLLIDDQLDYSDGLILVCGLLAYLVYNYKQAGLEFDAEELEFHKKENTREGGAITLNAILVVIGIILLVFGSQVFVDNAVTIARLAGISEAVVGLTLVAVGTSVPELATSLIAAWRKQADIAIGNVIGSNMFNILCVLGITALLAPVLGDQFTLLDFAIMGLFSLILLPLAWTGLKLSRMEGLFLLSGYAVYLAFISQQG